jgi:hypothetical protein
VPAGAPGLVDTNTRPASSTATHSDAEGQEIPVSWCPGSTFSLAQLDPPPVGLVELSTSPASVIATHRDADAHDTAVSSPVLEMGVAVQPELDVNTSSPPTATHSAVDGQDTPESGTSGRAALVQAPPAGSVDVMT